MHAQGSGRGESACTAESLGRDSASVGRSGYCPALDGLRGLAIAGVVLFHTGVVSGGFLGVDLFFALSGFLISDLLLREYGSTATVSLVGFWGRRVRRLFPALAVVLVAVVGLSWGLRSGAYLSGALADGPWVQANLANWHLIAEASDYWARFTGGRVFEHLWSIAIEEQFYLVWPVLLLFLLRGRGSGHRRVAVVAALMAVASLVLMIVLVDPANTTRVYIGTDTRAFSLLLGVLVATEPVRDFLGGILQRWAGIATAVLVTAIVLPWVFVDGETSRLLFRGGLFAYSAAAAVLVLLCVQAPETGMARVLSVRPLVWLGTISYSLYLWHWPMLVLLRENSAWPRTVLAVALAVVAAAGSKYLIEDPIRFRASWARGRTGRNAFIAAMAALAALWLIVPSPRPAAISIDGGGVTAATPQGPPLRRLMWAGDSVGAQLALPLNSAATASGLTFESIAEAGGGNVVGPFSEQNWPQITARITASRPDVVVYEITTYDWGSESEQRLAYHRLVDTVTKVGGHVMFVSLPPIRPDEFYAPHLADLARTFPTARSVADNSAGRAIAVNADEYWGPTFTPDLNGDGRLDRAPDGIHTCPQGAAGFTNWLLGQLARHFSGFTPAQPASWIDTGWAASKEFTIFPECR
ncbi:acyltransferase family protein [Nocardia sp. NPDC051756]|uniref:acyltransferase family protein n=1 Tax=Nocardia sp. NPDC051756 TaxID=3154751 RepID=UPI003447C603